MAKLVDLQIEHYRSSVGYTNEKIFCIWWLLPHLFGIPHGDNLGSYKNQIGKRWKNIRISTIPFVYAPWELRPFWEPAVTDTLLQRSREDDAHCQARVIKGGGARVAWRIGLHVIELLKRQMGAIKNGVHELST